MIEWTHRAFFVAMGSTQIPKTNVDETFFPKRALVALLSLLASAALEDLHEGSCSLCTSMACSRIR